MRGGIRGHLAVDRAGEDELDESLREGLHAEVLALGDGIRDLVGATLADEVGDARIHDHRLDRRDPAPTLLGQQPLADHAAQDAGEDRPDDHLLLGREELDHPADRLGGVDRVQRREHEMARFRRLERGLGRLGVAQLADEDDVRVLAERAAQRLPEVDRVEADLALVDDAALVGMENLDRVLDRDDVLRPRLVHVVDHRGERRRLPRAGGARDEDQAAVLLGHGLHDGRDAELGERRHVLRDDAEGKARGSPLPVGVDAEARKVGVLVGDVEVAGLMEALEALGRAGADDFEDRREGRLVQRGGIERGEAAVPAEDGRTSELEVDVARPEFDRVPEEAIQVHG